MGDLLLFVFQEVSHHRPTPTNTNLIEIQTTSSLLEDPELVEEIVIGMSFVLIRGV